MKISSVLYVIMLVLSACKTEQTLYISDHYFHSEKSEELALLVKDSEDGEWQPFYCTIEGLDYEEGYNYIIKVIVKKEKENQNCSSSYQLKKIILKEKPEPSSDDIDLSCVFNKKWNVVEIAGFNNTTGETPYFALTETSINGNNGCNNFGGNVSISEKGDLKIGELWFTKMFCVNTAQLEMIFTNHLIKAVKIKCIDTLTLYDVDSNVLMKAVKGDKESKNISTPKNTLLEKSTPFPIKISYTKTSRGHFSTWVYDGKNIKLEQERPEMFQKTILISEKELSSINELIKKLDLSKLETLEAPSAKYRFDGAHSARMEITVGDTTYVIPTFDDGNPNIYIKELINKLKKQLDSQ